MPVVVESWSTTAGATTGSPVSLVVSAPSGVTATDRVVIFMWGTGSATTRVPMETAGGGLFAQIGTEGSAAGTGYTMWDGVLSSGTNDVSALTTYTLRFSVDCAYIWVVAVRLSGADVYDGALARTSAVDAAALAIPQVTTTEAAVTVLTAGAQTNASATFGTTITGRTVEALSVPAGFGDTLLAHVSQASAGASGTPTVSVTAACDRFLLTLGMQAGSAGTTATSATTQAAQTSAGTATATRQATSATTQAAQTSAAVATGPGPVFVAAGALQAEASTTALGPVIIPAGALTNDIMILAVMLNDNGTFTTPSGWAVITSASSANISSAWFWKRHTGSETDPSTTTSVTMSTTIGGYGRIYVIRGCVTTGTPYEGEVLTSALSTTPATGAVTTTAVNERAFAFLTVDDDNTWSSGMPPAGWALAGGPLVSTTGGDAMFDAIQLLAPTTTTLTATTIGTMSASDYWRAVTLAFVPPPTSGASATSATTQADQTSAGTATATRQATSATTQAAQTSAGTATATRQATSATTQAAETSTGTATTGTGSAPDAPTSLRPSDAFGYSGSVALDWDAPAGGTTPTDYVIQWSTNGGGAWTTYTDGTSTTTAATLTGLTLGVRHIFRVASSNAGGLSAYTVSEWGCTPVSNTAPRTPPTGTTQTTGPAGAGGTLPWGLDRIDQRANTEDGSYHRHYTGAGVIVYTVDCGIYVAHDEFVGGRVEAGYSSLVGGTSANTDTGGHGTAVASIIGGNHVGVANGVTLVPVKIYENEGAGSGLGTADSPQLGLRWIATDFAARPAGTRAVVASSVYWAVVDLPDAPTSDYMLSEASDAIDELIALGIPFVQITGNTTEALSYRFPDPRPGLIYVGASEIDDAVRPTSNPVDYGTVFAPGTDIPLALTTGTDDYAAYGGTSFAAPHAGGVIALILEANPTLTVLQIEDVIVAGSTKDALTGDLHGSPNRILYSLVDVPAAPTTATSTTTQAGQTSTGTATTTRQAVSATTQAEQTSTGTATATRQAVSAATQAEQTSTGTATATRQTVSATTQATQTGVGLATPTRGASSAVSEADDVGSGVTTVTRSASASGQQSDQTSTGTASATRLATSATTQTDETSTGTASATPITSAASTTTQADQTSTAAAVATRVALSSAAAADQTSTATANATRQATSATTQADETSTGIASPAPVTTATSATTQADQTSTGLGTPTRGAYVAASEADDAGSATALRTRQASATAQQGNQLAAALVVATPLNTLTVVGRFSLERVDERRSLARAGAEPRSLARAGDPRNLEADR